jgi:plasmid stabilization system protein ParE
VVAFSKEALADLQSIHDYIARDNPKIAAKKAEMLANACELLDAFPYLGPVYIDPLRYFVKDLWVIAYRPAESGLYI